MKTKPLEIPDNMELEFLSVPYTHTDPKIEGQRLLLAQFISSKLSRDNRLVYSPVVHFATVSNKFGMPTTWAYWERLCIATIMNCNTLVCVKMDGWDISTGVQAELKVADDNGKSIHFLDPHPYIVELQALNINYEYWVKGSRFLEIYAPLD